MDLSPKLEQFVWLHKAKIYSLEWCPIVDEKKRKHKRWYGKVEDCFRIWELLCVWRPIAAQCKHGHSHMAASISSELIVAPFGASSASSGESSDRSWEETSSMAEFSWSIFCASIFRVFCESVVNLLERSMI